ncbi:restriction endonuclease subunit S [Bacillus wiedmannii]|uniref:restriction endonuclease subunit S n=1 Tax=Bacillus wiedmannii TaxID=1890302 RepID=UPI0016702CF6|nr:restriction endonuclease subunit S [Bacillus wiedmannii]
MRFLQDELKIARTYKLKNIVRRVGEPVKVEPTKEYTQIGIRSHGKGIFIKDSVSGLELGNKRVFWMEPDCFIVNIVFAWELAVSRTTDAQVGYIASHRFPMYKVDKELINLDYFTEYFQTKKGKSLLELASPGGAGRNKTLGQKEFLDLEITVPNLEIQNYITSFIKLLDSKIQRQQKKIELLKEQKKSLMQKIFKQEIRFNDENGKDYPKWDYVKLGELTKKTGTKNKDGIKYPVASISNKLGFTLQGEKKNSSTVVDIKAYKLVHRDEFAYNPSRINVGSFGLQDVAETAIVSSLYVIFQTVPELSNSYLKAYMQTTSFNQDVSRNTEGSVRDYLFYENFSSIKIPLPLIEEQEQIADFLSKLDNKIQLEQQKLQDLQEQKKGFMQQMFI